MSKHEKWFKSLNENGKTVYFLGNEHKVSKMAWDFQQAEIDQLKAQLTNMEQCYIGMKKERDGLQNCIKNLVDQKTKANSKLDNAYMVLDMSWTSNTNALLRKIDSAKKALRGTP